MSTSVKTLLGLIIKEEVFQGTRLLGESFYRATTADLISIIGGGSIAWGGITGTLANQTDIQSALDLKLEPTTEVNPQTFNFTLTLAGGVTQMGSGFDVTSGSGAFKTGSTLVLDAGSAINLDSILYTYGAAAAAAHRTALGLTTLATTTPGVNVATALGVALDGVGGLASTAYADSLVVGLLDDRGNYDASVNTFPASGGSGTAGAILKGDLWTISVSGTLGGVNVTAGDVLRAKSDTPGQTAGNWVITENNLGYVPQNTAGTLALAGFSSITGTLAGANGGTNNGFMDFTGPATSLKTFTLPNASATILTSNAVVTVAQGGTGRATGTTAYALVATGITATGAQQTLAQGTTSQILVGGGAALPVWTTATGTGAPVREGSPTISGTLNTGAIIDTQAVGAVATDGISLVNPTAASSGSQQWSPALVQKGFGFGTGVNTSQAVNFRRHVVPVEAATSPTGTLMWDVQIGGGAYVNRMSLTSGGVLTTATVYATGSIYAYGGAGYIGMTATVGSNLPKYVTITGNMNFCPQDVLLVTMSTTEMTFADAKNIVFNATTGTKIGTATTQKLSFWNKTPIIQPTTGVTAATFVANTSGILNDSATFGGYTLGQIAAALINVGILA